MARGTTRSTKIKKKGRGKSKERQKAVGFRYCLSEATLTEGAIGALLLNNNRRVLWDGVVGFRHRDASEALCLICISHSALGLSKGGKKSHYSESLPVPVLDVN